MCLTSHTNKYTVQCLCFLNQPPQRIACSAVINCFFHPRGWFLAKNSNHLWTLFLVFSARRTCKPLSVYSSPRCMCCCIWIKVRKKRNVRDLKKNKPEINNKLVNLLPGADTRAYPRKLAKILAENNPHVCALLSQHANTCWSTQSSAHFRLMGVPFVFCMFHFDHKMVQYAKPARSPRQLIFILRGTWMCVGGVETLLSTCWYH